MYEYNYPCFFRHQIILGITRVFQRYLSAIPKELTPEIKIMLELFRDLAQKDGVNIVVEHAESSDVSDYLI